MYIFNRPLKNIIELYKLVLSIHPSTSTVCSYVKAQIRSYICKNVSYVPDTFKNSFLESLNHQTPEELLANLVAIWPSNLDFDAEVLFPSIRISASELSIPEPPEVKAA